MADLDFFFDPVCPWAWITSRWVTEVKQLRSYEVNWRFICLKMINENNTAEWYTPQYKAGHMAGLYGLRVADQVRIEHGNEQVAALYTALGEIIHPGGRRLDIADDPIRDAARCLEVDRPAAGPGRCGARRVARRVHSSRDRSGVRANGQGRGHADHHLPPRINPTRQASSVLSLRRFPAVRLR